MSVSCGVECVVVAGCMRWAWKRCRYVGSDDSASWTPATPEEFEPVPRICRLILAVYETDLHRPQFAPVGGYRVDPDCLIKRVAYEQTLGHAPPYIIFLDHPNKEIVLAIRGLNLIKESDYKLLLDNRLGMQMFDGGYVHHGLLKSAAWLLNHESETLKMLWEENGRDYGMVFAGHSLGSGVAALMTIIAVNHTDKLGGISRDMIRCYAVAPARCMSLNLAVKYANVIYSIVLQDDFLPRTPTPLEDTFRSIFCLPCLLFLVCLRDTFIPEGRKLRDPRRLYAPGRMYHIVERKFCRCGRLAPEVRTAIPVEGRFEHIVLSCNATSDHAIIWIEREAEKAFQLMKDDASCSETAAEAPEKSGERLQTLEKEHHDALERAMSLNVPHAVAPGEADQSAMDISVEEEAEPSPKENENECSSMPRPVPAGGAPNWDEVIKQLFKKSHNGTSISKTQADIDLPI